MQLPPYSRVINVLGRSERLCLIPATWGGGSGIDGLGDWAGKARRNWVGPARIWKSLSHDGLGAFGVCESVFILGDTWHAKCQCLFTLIGLKAASFQRCLYH